LGYHSFQNCADDPKKTEKMEPEFSQRSSDFSNALLSPRVSLITKADTCHLIYLVKTMDHSHAFSTTEDPK